MERDEPPPQQDSRELWFEDDERLPALPRGGGVNERRPRRTSRGTKVMTVLLLGLLVLMILAYTYLKDESLPWEEDLKRPIFTEKTPDLSAPSRMKVMLLAARKVNLNELPIAPAWEWEAPALAQVLDKHAVVLDNLRDLLEEKEDEWQPRSLLWMIEDFGSEHSWAALMRLKQAESAYLTRTGREEAAFLAATDLAVLAHLLERLDAWPSFMDRSLELQQQCAATLAILLRSTRLDAETLRRMQEEEYAPWAPSADSLRQAMSGYYSFERKLLLGPDGGEPPLPDGYIPVRTDHWLFFKPIATLHLFADSFRELKSESTTTLMARQNQIGFRIRQRQRSSTGLPSSNASGEEYFATRIQPYLVLPERHGLARAQHAAVMTLFAVRRFLLAEARLPKDASELTAAYLPEDVIDPFSGGRLQVNPVKGLIYSVGTDLRDDGGRPTAQPLEDGTEPTVEIGLSTAKKAGGK